MARRSVEIDLKANSAAAVRELKRLEKAAKDTDDAVDGIETAGKTMARALERATDDAIDELEATRRAVDALDQALGDVDMDPNALVADLKRAGLTAQDVEADADDLAAALKRAGDVKIKAKALGFTDLDQALGRTTDNSRTASTAIGGIGNSISELPGVGSLGPVAESMGMLAENALEGEANVKGLVLAGGGLAALGLAVKFVQGHFEELAAIKAWETEQVETFTESILEAGEAVDALVESYRNAGMVEVSTALNGVKDITSELARANITVDEWTAAVQGGKNEADELGRRLDAAGLSGSQVVDVWTGLIAAQEDYDEATRKAADRTRVFGDETVNAARDARLLANELNNTAGDYLVSISADTRAANKSLDDLMTKLEAIGARASAASIVAANRFNTGAPNITVFAPAGADLNWINRQGQARTGRAS